MMGLLTFYEADSFLHRRNPSVKLLAVSLPIATLTVAFDVHTPLAFWVLGLGALLGLGRVPLSKAARPLALFLLLGAVGFVGSNALFHRPAPGATVTVLWRAGGLSITAEGLRVGVSLALRMVAIVTFSMVYVATTDPTAMVLSLIQNARFPYRLGYGVLVAYRFLPLWRSELDMIRAAHRIRGVGERATLRGKVEQLRRYAVPLLASAIRKAERVSIAMDSKAFGARSDRTSYRQQVITRTDWLMLGVAATLTLAIPLLLSRLGLLHGFGVVPE